MKLQSNLKNIVIVGGGSAGWMTAAALTRALQGTQTRIQLVESEAIGTIGVGEATFPSIRNFNRILGIDEVEFIRETAGSFKLGIQFSDWKTLGHSYFHTFGNFGPVSGNTALWGQYAAFRRDAQGRGDTERLAALGELSDYCLSSVMARKGRFVTPSDDVNNLYSGFNYAYHFDASLYAAYLRRRAEKQGCERIEGQVVEAKLRADDGHIDKILLADGRELEGDLYIDCSGFRSLLLGDALKVPFQSYAHWLPVDGAWAMPTKPTGREIAPFTTATALSSGWAWRIGLQNRVGNGHVFSSRFIDPQDARAELIRHAQGEPLAEPRLIEFQTGHRRQFWEKNCVAIGLSASFLEPLESTSLYLIQAGITRLINLLPDSQPNVSLSREYNRLHINEFANIRDFIILHYYLSQRDDSAFWRHMRTLALPESLEYKIEMWKEAGQLIIHTEEGFDETSWLAIYTGLGLWPKRQDPLVPLSADYAQLIHRRKIMEAGASHVPLHADFIDRLCRARTA